VTAFFDTNIFVYAFTVGPKREAAERILAAGGVVSVQVLNELANVLRRKQGFSWAEIEDALDAVRIRFPSALSLTIDTHAAAIGLARDHGLHVYDALILAAALEAGCDTLFTEDMQHGRVFGGLTIRDPFREDAR
jgi:predicted nucleic acid-binding protein